MIEWFLNYKDELSGQIYEFEWRKNWDLKVFDFEVSVQTPFGLVTGRALAFSRTSALEKALSECFERAICLELSVSSNGVAAHPDLNRAKIFAQNELIERDLFLCHFYTGSTVKALSVPSRYNNIVARLSHEYAT